MCAEGIVKDRKISVLVVEDSRVVRALLVHLLNSDPRLHVVGDVSNGREAVEFIGQVAVDVILMDLVMPEMDGFEATRRIMELRPVPIIVCSATLDPHEAMTTFRAMEAGAVACVEKPVGPGNEDFEKRAAHLLDTVRLMSEVKVIRRWARRESTRLASAAPAMVSPQKSNRIDVVGIGASTGGPPVLQTILASLPKDFPVPILIVQHIALGFLPGLVGWLNQTTGVKVQIASYGVRPQPGQVYLAPDDFHMTVRIGGEIVLSKEPPEDGLRPAVTRLFRSLAEVYRSRAVGVLLTGMGKDGAEGLKQMRDNGAVTIVQDRETSVVHGMPGEAIALDAACRVLPADRIGPALVALVNQQTPRKGDET